MKRQMTWDSCYEVAKSETLRILKKCFDLDTIFREMYEYALGRDNAKEILIDINEYLYDRFMEYSFIIERTLCQNFWGKSIRILERDNFNNISSYTNKQIEDLKRMATHFPDYCSEEDIKKFKKAINNEDWFKAYKCLCKLLRKECFSTSIAEYCSSFSEEDINNYVKENYVTPEKAKDFNESKNKSAWKYNNLLRG